ncbi:MAG TPA: hypothetical protein PKV16_03625 [Caldisericia bacterium]|nr:hypothetical protein [Caldisericia bacterium]HPF48401.1 hypothetical protein [Caldisericia bacterium]HPI83419.1 hypothetical protein [Caldisericia bacterium]HPQ92855.1 hypothetical protein [Caldisericia bacterium]HRV74047.1 hypothetical protein [Caldisericia bacterium]
MRRNIVRIIAVVLVALLYNTGTSIADDIGKDNYEITGKLPDFTLFFNKIYDLKNRTQHIYEDTKICVMEDNELFFYKFQIENIDGGDFPVAWRDEDGSQIVLETTDQDFIDYMNNIFLPRSSYYFETRSEGTNYWDSNVGFSILGQDDYSLVELNTRRGNYSYEETDPQSIKNVEEVFFYYIDECFNYACWKRLNEGQKETVYLGTINPNLTTKENWTPGRLSSSSPGFISFESNSTASFVMGVEETVPSKYEISNDNKICIPAIWTLNNLAGAPQFKYDPENATFTLRRIDGDHIRRYLIFKFGDKTATYTYKDVEYITNTVELEVAPYVNDSGVIMMGLDDFCKYLNTSYIFRPFDGSILLYREKSHCFWN